MTKPRARVSLPRQVGRLCTLILVAHGFMTGSITLFSRVATDKLFEQHWEYSTSVLMRRRNYFRFWEPSFYLPALTGEERDCLEAWLSLVALEAPPLVSRTWSPYVIAQDSLAMLDGMGEMRDAVYALSHCLHKVTPYVQEIRREHQGPVTFLHCRTKLDVQVRIPLTSYAFSLFTLPTTTTLQLDRPSYSPNKLHISAAEHRWWGGGVWSSQTGSVRSPWGDMGDLVRRYNGFMMSTMITKEATVQEKVMNARLQARLIDKRMRAQQEKQLAEMQEDHMDIPTP